MANNIIKRVWNQNRMVNIEDLCGMAFQAEAGGHTFQISGVDDTGAVVPLSGTVTGVFRRPDNADIAMTGSSTGGVASVTLTDDCYAIPGRFWLTIYTTADGQKTAIYAAVGTVAATNGGAVAGDTPQDVVDLINAIKAAIAEIPASYDDIMGAIAPIYSTSAVYAVGQYAWYNGVLKRCVVPITSGETYTAAHWETAVVGNDVADLGEGLITVTDLASDGEYIFSSDDFESGTWSFTTKAANSKRIRTRRLIPVKAGSVVAYSNPNMKIYIGVFATRKASAYAQATGWINAGSSGTVTLTSSGYMVIMFESAVDIGPTDYDSTVNLQTSAKLTTDAGFSNLKQSLFPYNPYDAISFQFAAQSGSANSVTWTWSGYTCTVTGTASTSTASPIIRTKELPPSIVAGGTYDLVYETTNTNIQLGFIWFDANDTPTYAYFTESQKVTVPSGTVKWSVRLFVESGKNANGIVSKISLLTQEPYADIFERISDTEIFKDYLRYLKKTDATSRGLTLHQNNDGSFSISGTASSSGAVYFDIVYNRTSFPDGVSAGGSYWLFVKSSTFKVRVITYTSGSDSGTVQYYESGSFLSKKLTIPSNATGITIRLQNEGIVSGQSYSENGIRVCFCNGDSFTTGIMDAVSASNGNTNAKIWCIGNSFMNGAVWVNNAFDHLVNYADSIYGQAAVSLGIAPANCDHVMYSSTGLTYDAGSGSFLDIITATDITPYDFLMTQMSSGDINVKNLGTVNSTDNDGTLAGAVVHLVNYIKTNNGLCKLILFSVPPYNCSPELSGQNVFTGNWTKGYSINDLDNVMYALAKKYHFIYISWQDLEISYHYTDYADWVSGQTGPRHAKSDRVYRAFGQYVGLQIKAVSSPIAVGKLMS